MIDRKEVKEIVEKSYLDDANANLYLFENIKTKQDPVSIYELNIDDGIVQQIRKISKQYVSSIIDSMQAESLSEIPIYNPDREQDIFKIDSHNVEMFNVLYKYISGNKPCTEYKKDKVRDDKLKAWIFRFEAHIDGNIEQLLFFQRFQPSKMLGSKKVTIFEHGKEFILLEKNFLTFNLVMDLVFYKETFIVTRASSFENIFGYEEYYKNNATKLVSELSEHKFVGLDFTFKMIDVDAVNNKIGTSTRLAHRLCSAYVNGYFKKINYNKLVGLNKKYELNLNLNDGKREWTIDEQLDSQVMARILNDDYELSQLTDHEYIAVGKEMIH